MQLLVKWVSVSDAKTRGGARREGALCLLPEPRGKQQAVHCVPAIPVAGRQQSRGILHLHSGPCWSGFYV